MFGKSEDMRKDHMMKLIELKDKASKIVRNIIFEIKWHMSKIITALIVIGILILFYAASWGITCGIIKLITLCFDLPFSLKYATGIWLLLNLIKSILPKEKK